MTTDLFGWLDALWTKTTPEGTAPLFMMHRFMASDRELANAARYLQQDLRREPDLLFQTWKGLLPKGKGAPRFAYVVAKKPAAAEALTIRMMQVLSERRTVVEEMQLIVAAAGKTRDLYLQFGIKPPEGDAKPLTTKGKKKPASGGLLGHL